MRRVLHTIANFVKTVLTFPIRLVQTIVDALTPSKKRGKRRR